VLLGLLPAITAVTSRDRPGAATGQRVHGRGRHLVTTLLVAEIAVTLVMTIGGALLLQSYSRLMRVDPGFDPASVLTFNVTLRPLPRLPRPPTPQAQAARTAEQLAERNLFYAEVIAAVQRIPGVSAIAASTDLPIAEGNNYHNFVIDGRPVQVGTEPEAYYRGINDDFFEAMKLPMARGRAFTADDHSRAQPVVIVNETLAQRYFPGEDAIGKRINWLDPGTPWLTIVGVAKDVKGLALDADEVPAVYGPYSQDRAVWRRSMDFAVRTSVDPASIAPAVRRAVAAVDPTVPATRMLTMQAVIGRSTADRRFMLTCLEFFSTMSLTLIVVGLYGVVSYAVRMRTAEFGVRLALGARPGSVVRLALRQAWWSTLAGTAIGIAGALAGARVLTSLLFHVSQTDAPTYALSAAGVVVIATLAALLPARRAGKVDPLMLVRRGV
jgi:predicted permease